MVITAEMVEAMRPGSVIVDLAIESGGNVEGSVLGKMVERGELKFWVSRTCLAGCRFTPVRCIRLTL